MSMCAWHAEGTLKCLLTVGMGISNGNIQKVPYQVIVVPNSCSGS